VIAEWSQRFVEPVIDLGLRLAYLPGTGRLDCQINTQEGEGGSMSVALAEPPRGQHTLSFGLKGAGEGGDRYLFASLWLRRLEISAPGLEPVASNSLEGRLGRAQRQVAAGLPAGAGQLARLSVLGDVDRRARIALALSQAKANERDAVAGLLSLLAEERDASPPVLRSLALHSAFALSVSQRRALATAYLRFESQEGRLPVAFDELSAYGSALVQANPRSNRDDWGLAFLCFVAAGEGSPDPPALDLGRAYLMTGSFGEGIEILRPLEVEALGSSRGRLGYAAWRQRRLREAIKWWSPLDERLKFCSDGIRAWYTKCCASAKRDVPLR
jgi:hypothetical protein